VKLLLVDDDELNRMVLEEMILILFDERIKIEVYETPERVLSLDVNSYDLILSDITMPKIDGYELYTKLRQKGYEKPIIAVTALAITGDKEKILMHGFSDYLSKPIDIQKLQNILQKYI